MSSTAEWKGDRKEATKVEDETVRTAYFEQRDLEKTDQAPRTLGNTADSLALVS